MELSYILNELGEERDSYFQAVAPPIIQTSNFTFKSVADFRKALANEYEATLYSRGNNPTVDILRKKLAALDGAEDALVFGSGIAAIATPILALLHQGDHVVSVAKPYSWTIKLFEKLLPKFGITTTFVDGTQVENFSNAIRPNTRLIYLESPNTFTYELQDIKAVSALAKKKGILTMIDNSYCSPLNQQPIKMGVDLVAQSATKFIGGHSDVVAGVVTGSKSIIKKIFDAEFLNIGGTISPMNAWLLIRGLRTLPIRLQRVCDSTKKVVDFLAQHPRVEKVIFPFHPGFTQYELAKKQMLDAGGLFSIVLKTDSVAGIEKFCNSLKHFLLAVSWGGHESLVIPSVVGFTPDQFDPANTNHRIIRLYVGLEDPDYLISDLKQALDT
ncbi:MAG TPA: aminotransferase class I/II-fold pyridoxal phosphate-dependent enzyme [Cyclobacteriaceae bacterium]|nr:aminotransferase class I/II-fold pyridoxal phosphate-dependent enzyme [Cytophagales bacterium]HNT49020.1 aminotransferase class I/II-fold pyridoxal phosphate-dependent enzyme [Cyclobacteriaceae bacterium]HRE65473.1 aminotransferase class I/II-fold pyridoxal phosphate-dependent enzyme [Cyclobacteriaceae bacterium]HRF32609.1 aminotransferase class I/II-fold pyridoxal phosphate-dependent enzyme [Cyclobacteriaceae bacterium]